MLSLYHHFDHTGWARYDKSAWELVGHKQLRSQPINCMYDVSKIYCISRVTIVMNIPRNYPQSKEKKFSSQPSSPKKETVPGKLGDWGQGGFGRTYVGRLNGSGHKKGNSLSQVQFSHSVVPDSLWPHGLHQARPPWPSTIPGVYSNSCPSSRWCLPTISFSVIPLSSCLHSFSTSESFEMNQFFASGGQSIGVSASASVLRMNVQD